MSTNTHESRLLVFTLGPIGECHRRRLLPARLAHVERSLHRRGLETALAAGRANGCALEVSSPHLLGLGSGVHLADQPGRSFGERFRRAVRAAHSRSRGPLLVVGSDVPGLTGGHLAQALEELGDDPNRVVVGPSPDGGFYLLATHRPLDAELARVRWCTRRTLGSLLEALRASGFEVCLLEPLSDLDRPGDLWSWLASEAARLVAWRDVTDPLRRLLAVIRRPDAPETVGQPCAWASLALATRGPPV